MLKYSNIIILAAIAVLLASCGSKGRTFTRFYERDCERHGVHAHESGFDACVEQLKASHERFKVDKEFCGEYSEYKRKQYFVDNGYRNFANGYKPEQIYYANDPEYSIAWASLGREDFNYGKDIKESCMSRKGWRDSSYFWNNRRSYQGGARGYARNNNRAQQGVFAPTTIIPLDPTTGSRRSAAPPPAGMIGSGILPSMPSQQPNILPNIPPASANIPSGATVIPLQNGNIGAINQEQTKQLLQK